ncbi:hypothetical protein [Micromonospora sp. DT31]|uniref:hypothetical protein n=1 Tax=Micromonospora sp. DT31 TaxID=3393434 RepID=UPI003CF599B6
MDPNQPYYDPNQPNYDPNQSNSYGYQSYGSYPETSYQGSPYTVASAASAPTYTVASVASAPTYTVASEPYTVASAALAMPMGRASTNRAMAFNAVQNQGAPGTALKAHIYIKDKNGNETDYQSAPFMSGTEPKSGSRYSTWTGAGSEVRKSKKDAEVHALDWAYDKISRLSNKKDIRSIQVDLVVSSGTCNECKDRQQKFVNDVAKMLPMTKSSRSGQYRIKLQSAYDNNRTYPASGGRPNAQGAATTTYGYEDSELRVNAAALNAGTPYQQAQYFSRPHAPGSPSGFVAPGSSSSEPVGTEPRTDRYSPDLSSGTSSGKSRTPSPPKSYAPSKDGGARRR